MIRSETAPGAYLRPRPGDRYRVLEIERVVSDGNGLDVTAIGEIEFIGWAAPHHTTRIWLLRCNGRARKYHGTASGAMCALYEIWREMSDRPEELGEQ